MDIQRAVAARLNAAAPEETDCDRCARPIEPLERHEQRPALGRERLRRQIVKTCRHCVEAQEQAIALAAIRDPNRH